MGKKKKELKLNSYILVHIWIIFIKELKLEPLAWAEDALL